MTRDGKALAFLPGKDAAHVIHEGDWERAWAELGTIVRHEMADDPGKWANITISHEGTVCDTMFCMANVKEAG